MKKIFLSIFSVLFITFITMPVFADVMPVRVSTKYTNTIGLYQANDCITLYKKPDEKSPVIYSIRWSAKEIFPPNMTFEDVFVVFIPSKKLALLAVSDIDDSEEWLEVIYNNDTGAKGWIKKDDPYKFMTWINFYNMYGRKYGLYELKGAPGSVNDLKSSTEDTAQSVAHVKMAEKINLTAIRGNWALVSVLDIDRRPKTGYMRWRSDEGIKYLFPAIK